MITTVHVTPISSLDLKYKRPICISVLLKLFLFLNLRKPTVMHMFVLCSMDVSHLTLTHWDFFPSICVGLTHFSLWPRPTVSIPNHMCGGGGICESLSHRTCWHRLRIWHWTLLFCLSSTCCMSSSMLATVLDLTKAKNAAYVHCQTLRIYPSTSLRWHHDLSHSFLNLPNNFSHFFLFLLTRPWWSTWFRCQSDYTICVDHYSQGNIEKWEKASFFFFFSPSGLC